MANTLSGIRGILELSDPSVPLSHRNRTRLEAILTEGMGTLEKARHLAMDTLPEALSEPGSDWRRRLETLLQPLSVIFRCSFEVCFEGEPALDRWPGELLMGHALALTRQILPYLQGGVMQILCTADARGWTLRWQPVSTFPESLKTGELTGPQDVSARWVHRTGVALGARLDFLDGAVLVNIPRGHAEG